MEVYNYMLHPFLILHVHSTVLQLCCSVAVVAFFFRARAFASLAWASE